MLDIPTVRQAVRIFEKANSLVNAFEPTDPGLLELSDQTLETGTLPRLVPSLFDVLFAWTLLLARFLGRHWRRLAEGVLLALFTGLFAFYFRLHEKGRQIAAKCQLFSERMSKNSEQREESPEEFLSASQEASEMPSTISCTGSSPDQSEGGLRSVVSDNEWIGVERVHHRIGTPRGARRS